MPPPPQPPAQFNNQFGSAEISMGALNPDMVPPGGMIEGKVRIVFEKVTKVETVLLF